MARDKNRIKPFCNEFALLWENCFSDLRFGQLCSNFFGWLMQEHGVDLFFPEEDKMIKYFREYCKENSRYFDTTNYAD